MKVSCNKGWGNKSKEKGDELAGSLKQAESKFAYVTIALSTLIPNVPSWFSRQKPWDEEKGLKEMPPGEGQSTKQVMSIQ